MSKILADFDPSIYKKDNLHFYVRPFYCTNIAGKRKVVPVDHLTIPIGSWFTLLSTVLSWFGVTM